jgi:hypothetical protein
MGGIENGASAPFLFSFSQCAPAHGTQACVGQESINASSSAENNYAKGSPMNSIAWMGIIFWGLLLTGFGLVSAGPAPQPGTVDIAAHDVFFLITGGLLTCLIGITGLMGFMGWVPGLRKEQKSIA